MNFSKKIEEDLKRAKDLLSHKFPKGSDADVIGYALKFLLDKTDPLRKKVKVVHRKTVGTDLTKSSKQLKGLKFDSSLEASPSKANVGNGERGAETDSSLKNNGKKLDAKANFTSEVETQTKVKIVSTGGTNFKAVNKTAVSRRVYTEVLKHAQGKCTFVDLKTGRRCGRSFQVQVDHRIARAVGGSNDISNLRALCRVHNMYEAERVFGARKMEQYYIQNEIKRA